MRKIIVSLLIVVIGILCLSFTSRITDGVFDNFFDGESSSTSGSGNNGSGSSGSDNDNSETVELKYQRSGATFGRNYIVDVSSYENVGNYYYYLILDSDMYAKFEDKLVEDPNYNYVVDCNSYVYKKTETTVSETSDVTEFFILSSSYSITESIYFSKIGTSDDMDGYKSFWSNIGYRASVESPVYYYTAIRAEGAAETYNYYYFAKSLESAIYHNCNFDTACPVYAITSTYTAETDEYVEFNLNYE